MVRRRQTREGKGRRGTHLPERLRAGQLLCQRLLHRTTDPSREAEDTTRVCASSVDGWEEILSSFVCSLCLVHSEERKDHSKFDPTLRPPSIHPSVPPSLHPSVHLFMNVFSCFSSCLHFHHHASIPRRTTKPLTKEELRSRFPRGSESKLLSSSLLLHANEGNLP